MNSVYNALMGVAQDVATYCGLVLLKEGMTVSPLKLQKMLYYIQAWMMMFSIISCCLMTSHKHG